MNAFVGKKSLNIRWPNWFEAYELKRQNWDLWSECELTFWDGVLQQFTHIYCLLYLVWLVLWWQTFTAELV